MPATYRCGGCNATWTEDREPADCPKCGSRFVERMARADAVLDDPYLPPGSSMDARSTVSSASFSVLYWLGWAGFILGFALIGAASSGNDPAAPAAVNEPLATAGALLAFASGACLVAALIVAFVKVYRGWKAIQPLRQVDRGEVDMPTPGAAVGLLFVPFYNLYWIFVSTHGLAVRANKFMARSGVGARPMNEGLALAYCILTVCSVIPCVNLLIVPVNAVIYYLFILDVDRMRGAIQASSGGKFKPAHGDDFEAL